MAVGHVPFKALFDQFFRFCPGLCSGFGADTLLSLVVCLLLISFALVGLPLVIALLLAVFVCLVAFGLIFKALGTVILIRFSLSIGPALLFGLAFIQPAIPPCINARPGLVLYVLPIFLHAPGGFLADFVELFLLDSDLICCSAHGLCSSSKMAPLLGFAPLPPILESAEGAEIRLYCVEIAV
ncbi:hypothetical protein [Acidithiobacillus ferriphilus]|uniref:hypothetical protein n=1 Tax=Acidithiobacillus ferriphilus TaxID=1689834 RepID=UPI002DB966B8|nr:hypothetical protein [Acidithiobacillus ferriphilus]MEB8535377.1 hypothetical protein [Acidithiobacillus ferriphilus]